MAAELSRQLCQPLPDSLVRDDSTCCEIGFGLKLCRKRGIRGKVKNPIGAPGNHDRNVTEK